MLGNGRLAVHAVSGIGIQGGIVVLGRAAHAVGHDVHKVQILDDTLEIHVLGTGLCSHREEFVVTQGFTKLLNKEGEVLDVGRRAGDSAVGSLGREFPVNVYTVQFIVVYQIQAALAEALAVLGTGGHFAEPAGTVPANGKEHFQIGIVVFEIHNLFQARGFFFAEGHFFIVAFINLAEGEVDVCDQVRIGQGSAGAVGVADNDMIDAGNDDRCGVRGRIRTGVRIISGVTSLV